MISVIPSKKGHLSGSHILAVSVGTVVAVLAGGGLVPGKDNPIPIVEDSFRKMAVLKGLTLIESEQCRTFDLIIAPGTIQNEITLFVLKENTHFSK